MAHLPKPFRFLLLASTILLSTVSVSSAGAATCSASGLLACPAGLPDNFCCSSSTTCIALAGNTTALCCPEGQSCNKIQPITCDVSLQNPEQNESVPIKTTVFNVALKQCGTNLCCPFGYSCYDGNQCVMNQDQSQPPSGDAISTSSVTASARSTATPTSSTATSEVVTTTASLSTTLASSSSSSSLEPTPTTDSSPSSSSSSSEASTASTMSSAAAASSTTAETVAAGSNSSGAKTATIVGGVAGGCAALVLLVGITFFCIRRNRRSQDSNPEKGVYGRNRSNGPAPHGQFISEPITQPNSYRTDFILKSPSASSSISQQAPPITSPRAELPARFSIPNPFNSPNLSARSLTPFRRSTASADDRDARTGDVSARLAPIRTMKASTSRLFPRKARHEDGGSTNVFTDPSTAGISADEKRGTTFTELMMEADLGDVRRGKPYVPPDSVPMI